MNKMLSDAIKVEVEESLGGQRRRITVTALLSNGHAITVDGLVERTIFTRNEVRHGVSWPSLGRMTPQDARLVACAIEACAAEVDRLREEFALSWAVSSKAHLSLTRLENPIVAGTAT